MTDTATIDLRVRSEPYPHAVTTDALEPELADRLHRAIAGVGSWERASDTFYRHAKVAFTSESVPPPLDDLLTAALTARVRRALETAFAVRLRPRAEMMLNRFGVGDGTMIHNDYMPDPNLPYYFTHRALLYLNPGWVHSMGGLLGIFDSADAAVPVSVIEPRHNTMAALAMGPQSFHAVSALRGPERHSVVWSFCSEDQAHQR